MNHALGHCYPLVLFEDESTLAFNIEEQLALQHQEEFVFVVVLVPVELALEDSQAHDRVVDCGQCLVEPRYVFGGLFGNVDLGEVAVFIVLANVEARGVRLGGNGRLLVVERSG